MERYDCRNSLCVVWKQVIFGNICYKCNAETAIELYILCYRIRWKRDHYKSTFLNYCKREFYIQVAYKCLLSFYST